MTPKRVLITGTTSGIGQKLMAYYREKNIEVIAVNRRKLPEWSQNIPGVRFETMDVRDQKKISEFISHLKDTQAMPDFIFLNAGINRMDNDVYLNLDLFQETIDTNLYGALNFASAITALPIPYPKTTLVAVSSVTNYVANPYCMSYYISKLALIKSFDILEGMYRKTPLQFKWAIIGPVLTPIMASNKKFPKWMIAIKDSFSVTPEATAAALDRLAHSKSKHIVYPLRAYFLFQAMRLARWILPGFYRGQKKMDGSSSHA